MFDEISITGITKIEEYPDRCKIKNCKQNLKSIKVNIPCAKPDIESINEVKISICIEDYKVIDTILGKKTVVNLIAKIKVIYTALNELQSIHSAHWETSFCDFILDEDSINNCYKRNTDIFIGLEEVYIHNFDERTVYLSIVYILYTIQKELLDRRERKCEEYIKNIECKERNTYCYPVEVFINNNENCNRK